MNVLLHKVSFFCKQRALFFLLQLSDIKDALKMPFNPSHLVPTYTIQGIERLAACVMDLKYHKLLFLIGREFEAIFISTVEALDPSGCSLNPTKSLCSPSVFNTVITRARSLVVAIGNPYVLMSTEKKMPDKDKQCWAHYLHRCFETETVKAGEGIKSESLQELQRFVNQKLNVFDADQDHQDNELLSNSTSQENKLVGSSLGKIYAVLVSTYHAFVVFANLLILLNQHS